VRSEKGSHASERMRFTDFGQSMWLSFLFARQAPRWLNAEGLKEPTDWRRDGRPGKGKAGRDGHNTHII